MYKLLVIFGFLIVNSIASDLHNLFYDEVLANEFNDFKLSLKLQNNRFKRDVEEHKCSAKLDDVFCCHGEVDEAKCIEMTKVRFDCFSEMFKNETEKVENFDAEKIKAAMPCMFECIFRKSGWLNDDGDVDKAKLLEHMKHDDKNAWKTERADEIADKCVPEKSAEDSSEESEKQCKIQPLKTAYCVWGKLIESCPKELQADSEKCNKIREDTDALETFRPFE